MSITAENRVELIDQSEVSDKVSEEELDFLNSELLPAIAEQMRYLHEQDKSNPATLREYLTGKYRPFGEVHDFLDNVAGQYVYPAETSVIIDVFSKGNLKSQRN